MSLALLFVFSACSDDTEDNLSDSNANTKVLISVKSDAEKQSPQISEPTQTTTNNEGNVDSVNKQSQINSSADGGNGETYVTVPNGSQDTNNTVWVPVNGGTKYHSKSTCSNMKNPVEVSKETAIADGFSPCARCY